MAFLRNPFKRPSKEAGAAAAASPQSGNPLGSDSPPVSADAVTGTNTDEDVNGTPLEPTATTASEMHECPEGLKLVLILLSVFVSIFLVALDRLIIATAIPEITNEFHSITDIGWYGSVYLLSTCAFQLLFGKLYTFWSIKAVFLVSVFLFEVGSAICGAAPNSVVFIVGRAIAGIGGAGIFSGAIVVLVYAVPLHKRPLYQSLFGAIFGIASVVGPLLGGAFTTNVTWRWCFYINLPFGGIAMVIIFFLLAIPDRDTTKLLTKKKLAQLDFAGTSVFIPGTICLLLALQWGGLDYAWNDGRIIALLVLAGVLLITFVAIQILMPKTATVPPRIFTQRSIAAGFWITLCIGSQMMIFVYFLPVWFQAIKGVSAVDSGIRMLPLVLSMVVASIISGASISRLGYYTPFMLVGICFMAVGAGLMTTLEVDTEQPKWAAYEFLFGFGLGFTFQAPNLAAQTVLPTRDVPIGTSLMFFSQLLGGAVFISVGQNVLNGQLLERLAGTLPGFDAEQLKNTGATSLTHLPDNIRPIVLDAYNLALRKVFQVGLILVCLTIIGGVFLEWRSVKEKKDKKGTDPEKGGEDGKKVEERGEDIGTDGEATDVDEKVMDNPQKEKKSVDEKPATASSAGTTTGGEKVAETEKS